MRSYGAVWGGDSRVNGVHGLGAWHGRTVQLQRNQYNIIESIYLP